MSEFLKYKIYICLFFLINICFVFSGNAVYPYVLLAIFFIQNIAGVVFFIASLCIKKDKKYNFNELGELPTYTILIPAYKEKYGSLYNLLQRISEFDYDQDKLDVKVLLEDDDFGTIKVAESLESEFHFEKVVVPYSIPRTKPKACNVGLELAKGKFLTIYDAEDLPDRQQLKKALMEFKNLPDDYICVQARLNYYNKNENILTRCFSMEYALYFNYYLQIFSYLFSFFSLSGTSNHFKVNELKKIGGWDAYNVTEDAELGMRIAFNKYKVKAFYSLTEEEAVTELPRWIRQRSRWMKGFLHTYLTYISKPIQTFRNFGLAKFLLMHFVIASGVVLPVLYLFFFMIFMISGTETMSILNIANLFSYLTLQSIIIILFLKDNKIDVIKNIFMIPAYMLYMSMPFYVSYIAIYEFFMDVSHWNKTDHCISKMVNKENL